MKRCQILLISGSLRADSTNTAVLQTARAVAPEAIATVLYGGMGALPHFNPDDDREASRSTPPSRIPAWYRSDTYRQIIPLRAEHSEGEIILVDGVLERHRATDILSEVHP